jgi:hypothetical protein
MINFFRKIRQRLLTENKFSKYLIYAIGEIVLVVIGILIALQLNNWNEVRKIRIQEIKALNELRSDLLQNINDIDENITYLRVSKRANEIILHHIENNLPYNDSLDFHFANLYPFITFSPNQTAFNSLNQSGMNLITNDSLRTKISDLFANRFNVYKVFEKTYLVEHYVNYIKPLMMSEFKTFNLYQSFKPNNYNQFTKNKEYIQIMNFSVQISETFIKFQLKFKKSINDLILQIDNEIAESTHIEVITKG